MTDIATQAAAYRKLALEAARMADMLENAGCWTVSCQYQELALANAAVDAEDDGCFWTVRGELMADLGCDEDGYRVDEDGNRVTDGPNYGARHPDDPAGGRGA